MLIYYFAIQLQSAFSMIKRHVLSPTLTNLSQNKIKNTNQPNALKTIFTNQNYLKTHLQKQNDLETDMTFFKDATLNQTPRSKHFNTKTMCSQCFIYSLKLQELTSSYEQLLFCKNQQINSCRDIICRLQKKVKEFELKYKQQTDRNKKIKHFAQNKIFNENNSKKQVNQAIQYLKKRQLSLLDNLNKIQNQLYVKEIHLNDQKSRKQRTSAQNEQDLNSQSQINSQFISEKCSSIISRNSKCNQKSYQVCRLQDGKLQVPHISMHQYTKKCNQLQLAHDYNLMLNIQSKIKTVKHLEDVLLKN